MTMAACHGDPGNNGEIEIDSSRATFCDSSLSDSLANSGWPESNLLYWDLCKPPISEAFVRVCFGADIISDIRYVDTTF